MTEMTTAYVLTPFAYGRGYPTLRPVADPGAGLVADVLVPGSRTYRLISVQALYTTSAVVANRTPMLVLLDGDLIEWLRLAPNSSIAASDSRIVVWHNGMKDSYVSGGGEFYSPLPDMFVPEGHTMQLTARNLDAGDTITNIKMFWEEFPIGGGGYRTGVVPALPPYPEP